MVVAACGATNKRGVARGCECAAGGARCCSMPELWEPQGLDALKAWGDGAGGPGALRTQGNRGRKVVVIKYSTTSRILVEY